MYFIYGYICFELDVASDFIIREMRRNEKFAPFRLSNQQKAPETNDLLYVFNTTLYLKRNLKFT